MVCGIEEMIFNSTEKQSLRGTKQSHKLIKKFVETRDVIASFLAMTEAYLISFKASLFIQPILSSANWIFFQLLCVSIT